MPTSTPPTQSLPKNHRLVYDVVLRSGPGRHLTATDVYVRASALRAGIGFSTVYRALTRLRDLELIAEVTLPGTPSATYEPIGDRHAHVLCRTCGRIADAAFAIPGDVLTRVANETGYLVDFGTVTFDGICGDCAVPALATT